MPEETADSRATIPVWCKVIFLVNIIVLFLTRIMLFVKIITGTWYESLSCFTNNPCLMQILGLDAIITFVTLVCGTTSSVLLLRKNYIGVSLGFITLALVGLSIGILLYGASYVNGGITVTAHISIWRVIYNTLILLAILKTRKIIKKRAGVKA